MAKKNKISALYLFSGGTVLFSLAWLMPSFPLLVFIGFAPFIGIVANNPKENSFWNNLELVLLGMVISLFCASFFDTSRLAEVFILSILYTLPFLGLAFVKNVLGEKTSLLTLIIFWLAIEYLLLIWHPISVNFLADIVSLKDGWTKWNSLTGYLGASCWILVCNYLFYRALLSNEKTNWPLLVIFILAVCTPIIYSYSLDEPGLTREQMMTLYASGQLNDNANYVAMGEFIPRTAAWVSVLILLFTFVKLKTSRKK